MEEVPLLRWNTLDTLVRQMCRIVHTEQARKVATLAHLPVYLIRHFLGLLPLGHVGLDLLVDPLSDFVTERRVGLVEVGRVVLRTNISIGPADSVNITIPIGTMMGRRMGSGRHTGPKPLLLRLPRMAEELQLPNSPLA